VFFFTTNRNPAAIKNFFKKPGTFLSSLRQLFLKPLIMETATASQLNTADLEQKVKTMYRDVALNPTGEYHFEMGRGLAGKLGYEKKDLDRIPAAAIESFAGVGYYFDIANLKEGEQVLDLGSGSGMDVFTAALKVGNSGKVAGVDMTDEQLEKAERLRKEYQFDNVSFYKSYIETLPFPDASFDVVISNGVINLSPDKEKVFKEVSRVLKPGGRMVIADIVTEKLLPENVTCNSTLWASCIGGASQQDDYRGAIEKTEMEVLLIRNNEAYSFISKSAKGASKDYGVKSISLLAEKKINNKTKS
jgi:arsenite methyltransferase